MSSQDNGVIGSDCLGAGSERVLKLFLPCVMFIQSRCYQSRCLQVLLIFAVLNLVLLPAKASAQITPPTKDDLFEADTEQSKEVLSEKVDTVLATDKPVTESLDFQAPEVEFRKEREEVYGAGGVVISRGSLQAQANEAVANLETETGELEGNVLVTTEEAVIEADRATFNFQTETGEFENAASLIEDGGYEVRAASLSKLSEFQYALKECSITTCECPDGDVPWKVASDSAYITQEGYAHTYDTTFNVDGIPIIYSPYFAFPVKTERTSGLLVPEIGGSSRDGFNYKQPVFVVVDDHTDVLLTPFTETRTRTGLGADFRKVFSRKSSIKTGWIYSDESARGDALRGTVTDNLFDPTFDDQRIGGYYKQSWRSEPSWAIPSSFIADIHYVSDDLFIREIENQNIASPNARYVTSTAIARAGLGDIAVAEVLGEYNQAIQSDDDLIFQRLPEATVSLSESFRPFGFNPYGFKVVARGRVTGTQFERDLGYDGQRIEYIPSVRIPFHFRNWVENQVDLSLNIADYSLDETRFPDDPATRLEDSSSRTVPILDYRIGTGIEKVYDVAEDGALATLAALGSERRAFKLSRVKHTLEPSVQYRYIPDVDQDDLPFFDSRDRIRERSVFTFGLKSALLARLSPRRGSVEEITEIAPLVDELPTVDVERPLEDVGTVSGGLYSGRVGRIPGEITELASFNIRQSFDYLEHQEDNDLEREPWSDVAFDFSLTPNRKFGMLFTSNIDHDNLTMSSWSTLATVRDDRGDALRVRYNFVDNSVNQIEGNLELKLLEKVKLGYYARYDDRESEFIDSHIALRFTSACDCWHIDLGYREEINPDDENITLRFTLAGFGDITQDLSYREDEEEQQLR